MIELIASKTLTMLSLHNVNIDTFVKELKKQAKNYENVQTIVIDLDEQITEEPITEEQTTEEPITEEQTEVEVIKKQLNSL